MTHATSSASRQRVLTIVARSQALNHPCSFAHSSVTSRPSEVQSSTSANCYRTQRLAVPRDKVYHSLGVVPDLSSVNPLVVTSSSAQPRAIYTMPYQPLSSHPCINLRRVHLVSGPPSWGSLIVLSSCRLLVAWHSPSMPRPMSSTTTLA